MKIIDLVIALDSEGNETISPAEPFPSDAIRIICDGAKYTVYQVGDELPPDPVE